MKKHTFSMTEFALQGIGIGVPVTLVCMTLLGGWNDAIAEMLVWTVASALIGLLSGWCFYHRGEWSLLRATMTHGVGCLVLVVGAGWVCGYAKDPWELLLAMLPVFVVVYVAIYWIIYCSVRREAQRINEKLEKNG
ncbi:MAG: DUF3021 domain-containing protein [Lachnospiraceae bacterium]|nr:DUF3021 domain-containing protein [Lachnospiraceae bacterium]